MTCTKAWLCLFLFAPCATQASEPDSMPADLASAKRPEADLGRDAWRKPTEVLNFLGIGPGMTVLEVFAGGGYYTSILDATVAPNGRVLAHNNQGYLDFVGPQFLARFENDGLPRTDQVIAEANDIELEEASLDAVLMILTWHDFLYGSEQFNWPDVDEAAFIESLCAATRPGAVVGIVDHHANPGDDPLQAAFNLHRIDPERIQADLADSCFEFEAASDILRNPDDDRTTPSISGDFQGKTDRFVLKFRRR